MTWSVFPELLFVEEGGTIDIAVNISADPATFLGLLSMHSPDMFPDNLINIYIEICLDPVQALSVVMWDLAKSIVSGMLV